MRRQRSRWFPLIVLLCCTAAVLPGRATPEAPPGGEWPNGRWPEAAPGSRGVDGAASDRLVASIRRGERYPNIHGLLIVKDGYLVTEAYFDGWTAGRRHTLQSVSKSVTSAIVGIAIERGMLRGVDEKVLDIAAEGRLGPKLDGVEKVDRRKRAMRVEDLLTMRSGTDYTEGFGGSPHSRLNALSRGWDRFYLSRPMVRDPGTEFQYDSGGVIVLSSLIEARSGMHADRLAEEALFTPLGIEHVEWGRNREGHPHLGGGLHLRPRDVARFALLYLRDGHWGEAQVVPADWVRRSTEARLDLDRPASRVTGYGYLWWTHRPAPGDRLPIVAAHGFMGQYIFLVPEHDLAMVVTAGARGADQRRPIDFLYEHVLPAVTRPASEASGA